MTPEDENTVLPAPPSQVIWVFFAQFLYAPHRRTNHTYPFPTAMSNTHHKTECHTNMELNVQCFGRKDFVVEVGEDDTRRTMRQKVATAAGLAKDSFHMGFGGKVEGEDITELSAGDKIFLTKTPKYEAIEALHALGETDVTAERLEEVTDPKVASLLLQAEVARRFPDDFFSSSTAVTCIGSSGVSDVDDMRDTSLPHCDTILDLPNLPFVKVIRDSFLRECATLSTVDLSGLNEVTWIGNNFLSDCATLQTVDITGLQAVITIGNYFLADCGRLSTVNLSGLNEVIWIGNNFLSDSVGLSSVNLTGLKAVTSIGNNFLSGCGLSSVDLAGLEAVTSIGDAFLAFCDVQTVDFTGLKAVTEIGYEFFYNCPLTTLHGTNECSHDVRWRLQEIEEENDRRQFGW